MIDLTKYCCHNETRTYISKPWSHGDYTYATNGHVMLRVPRREDVPENPAAPDVEKVIASALAPIDMKPFPTCTLPAGEKCKHCHGKGRGYPCLNCGGEGEAECPTCSHIDECKECNGKGYALEPWKDGQQDEWCSFCDGDGVQWESHPDLYLAPNNAISIRYARWLQDLPNCQITMTPAPIGGHTAAIPFRFDAGEGWIMPVRPSTPRVGVDVIAYEQVPA